MRHKPTLFTAVLLLFLVGLDVAQGDDKPATKVAPTSKDKPATKDKPTSKALGKIQPPGGVPLPLRPGTPVSVDWGTKATKRLESAPEEDLAKWIVELKRITDKKLDEELEEQACRTYFVTRMSLAFDDLKWNAKVADKLFHRAEAMKASDSKVWKEAFEALLKHEPTVLLNEQEYAVPLVLIPVEPLFDKWKYNRERGKKYLARLQQLTFDDVVLWYDADDFLGTKLDAAVNIILLDDYFDNEMFQRDKFKAAFEVKKN